MFDASPELRFELPAVGPYEIEVFNAAGQRVADLSGIGRSGANAVRCDGHDDPGRQVSPGVSYCRLVSNGRAAGGKVWSCPAVELVTAEGLTWQG